MGAAGSVISSQQEESSVMPTHGVQLNQLQAFIDACGGIDTLQGLTVADVRDRFIKPMTVMTKSSFCDWLRSQNHPAVGLPSVFICHVWNYVFLDVVYALQAHFQAQPDVIIWFDIFTINQHIPVEIDAAWLEKLKAFIEGIGHVVLVYFPHISSSATPSAASSRPASASKAAASTTTALSSSSQSNNPFHRLWCIYELYAVAANQTKFDIAMKEQDIRYFTALIKLGRIEVIDELIRHIDIANSETSDPKHKILLQQALVQISASYPIEHAIVTQTRKWLIQFCLQLLQQPNPEHDEIIKANIQHILGILYVQMMESNQAKEVLMKCFEVRKSKLGESHPDTMVVMNNLALILFNEQNYLEAEKLFFVCLQIRKNQLGKEHPDTLAVMNNLALTYLYLKRYAEAQPLLVVALEIRKQKLGECHLETIQAMINLGHLYNEEGKYDKALTILENAFMKFNSTTDTEIDDANTSTLIPIVKPSRTSEEYLNVLKQLTTTFVKLQQFDDAEPLLVTCIDLLKQKLGDDHMETLEKKLELASIYKHHLWYDKAEMLLLACLQEFQSKLGDHHPTTVKTMSSLAILYYQLGNVEKAGVYFYQCYKISQAKLGDEHVDTKKLKMILMKIQKTIIAAYQKNPNER